MSPTSDLALRSRAGRSANWVWLSLIPLGLGSWAPAYAGSILKKRWWQALGSFWALVSAAGWALAIAQSGKGAVGGLLIILGWVGGFGTSLSLRAPFKHAVGSDFELAVAQSRERLEEQAQARSIAQHQPALAKQIGIGRPDIAGSQPAGLIDINHVPASVLTSLPGVDGALAARIVATREDIHGFSSLEDMGSAMNLDGDLVERIRDQVVFLPR